MKILHISTKKDHSCFYGLTLRQADSHEVVFVVLTPSRAGWYRTTTEYVERGIRYIHLNVMPGMGVDREVRLEQALRKIISLHRPDILHVQAFSGVNLSAVLAAAAGMPVKKIATLHDHALFCVRGTAFDDGRVCAPASLSRCGCAGCIAEARSRQLALPEFNEYRRARAVEVLSGLDALICCSQWQKDAVSRVLGFAEKIAVVHYGADADGSIPAPGKRHKVPVFAYAGSVSGLKGMELLMQACAMLPKEGYSLLMGVFYDPRSPEQRALLTALKGMGVPLKVYRNLRGERIHEKVYRQADYLVIPSLWEETGPMTLFEACACRVPVLVKDQPSMVEKLKGSKGNHVFSDAKGLSVLMRRIISGWGRKPKAAAFPARSVAQYSRDVEKVYRQAKRPSPRSLILKTGYVCNNNCIFCVRGDNTPKAFVEKALLRERIRTYAGKYTDLLVTGGEPTLHPGLVPLLQEASRAGFRITLETNGRALADKGLCRKLAELRPSVTTHVESYRSGLHDTITRAPGSFYQTVSGIRNIRPWCRELFVKVMIVKLNYRDLLMTAKFLDRLGVDRVWFVFLDPAGNAAKYFNSIIPAYKEVRPYLRRALEWLSRSSHCGIRLENFPHCVVDRQYRGFIWNQLHERRTTMFGVLPGTARDDTYYAIPERLSRKAYPAQCSQCMFRGTCEGVYRAYLEHFSDKEFIPVK